MECGFIISLPHGIVKDYFMIISMAPHASLARQGGREYAWGKGMKIKIIS
jgi:hypothetical protein